MHGVTVHQLNPNHLIAEERGAERFGLDQGVVGANDDDEWDTGILKFPIRPRLLLDRSSNVFNAGRPTTRDPRLDHAHLAIAGVSVSNHAAVCNFSGEMVALGGGF